MEETTGESQPTATQRTLSGERPSVCADKPANILQPAIIRAEANMLRFPVFKIGTRGVKNCDGFVATGSRTEGGQSQDFQWRVTRNTDDLYPSDQARRCHQALLAKLEKGGFPYQNSVVFSWRELAKLMDISWKGSLRVQLTAAIKSIHGLRIWSDLALKRKTTLCDVASKQEQTIVEPIAAREHGFQLYQEVIFQGQQNADGTVHDVNKVVFSDWYITNLNSFYYAKIDRSLWLAIDREGPIASRLYEYLLHCRSGRWNRLTIGYAKLCMYLPIAIKPTPSQAKQQLAESLTALQQYGIIKAVSWQKNAVGELMITFVFGHKLQSSKTPSDALSETIDDDSIVVRQIVNSRSPECELVRSFYDRWKNNPDHVPYQKELAAAREVVDDYTLEIALKTLPHVIQQLRDEFPDAKTFSATKRYWPTAHQHYLGQKATARRQQTEHKKKLREARQAELERQQYQRDQAAFLALPEDQQTAIHDTVLAEVSDFERAMVHRSEDTKLRMAVCHYQKLHAKT